MWICLQAANQLGMRGFPASEAPFNGFAEGNPVRIRGPQFMGLNSQDAYACSACAKNHLTQKAEWNKQRTLADIAELCQQVLNQIEVIHK